MKFRYIVILMLLTVVLAACGGDKDTSSSGSSGGDSAEKAPAPAASTGDAAHGEELYSATCVACHGAGGVGVDGLGKSFVTSEFVRGKTDSNLMAFIKEGRPTGDPDNTTGVDMPPKGGNPALSDDDLLDIIAYIRTINE
ncbi:MAG TPA: cytochrome c [Anaerolineae bacterium]|nr:cytochrome c [Anaerolineae bacterium]